MAVSFPESFSFDEYFLGHKSPVVGIALVEKGHILLSVEAKGKLKLWSSSDGKQCIDTYDIFTACHGPASLSDRKGDVCGMKVTEALGRIWIAVKILGSKEMTILKLRYLTREICKVSEVKIDSEFCDVVWNKESLYMYSPESTCVIKKFDATEHGLVSDCQFNVPKIVSYKADLDAFVRFNKSAYIASLQRLSSTDLFTSDNESCSQGKSMHDLNIEFADEEEVTTYEEADDEEKSMREYE
jgi:WD40 repeat protein